MSGEQVIFLVNFSGDTHQEIASSLREEGFKVVKDDLFSERHEDTFPIYPLLCSPLQDLPVLKGF